jgi:hypothetical protein
MKRVHKYTAFGAVLTLLVFGNVWVHARALLLSESAMKFEREISRMKYESLTLEEELARGSSLYHMSLSAQANGYTTSSAQVKWLGHHMVAAR